ncbi:hypothetical protein BRARA_F02724 [Brassica rapa]|uniref:Uncharacterized protein n=1 Tax=Brassica campestris TaxID=3711 RepID=A0A397Z1D3_BRACM|nr:hypothetical protein BRARA_F02724 [Brassica rapa]
MKGISYQVFFSKSCHSYLTTCLPQAQLKLQAEAAIAIDKPLQDRRRKEQREGNQVGDLNHRHLQSQNVRRESERVCWRKKKRAREWEAHTF